MSKAVIYHYLNVALKALEQADKEAEDHARKNKLVDPVEPYSPVGQHHRIHHLRCDLQEFMDDY